MMTVFTSLQKAKSPEMDQIMCDVWDLFLADGFQNILKTIVFVLELQFDALVDLDAEELLIALKNIETHPLNVLIYSRTSPKVIEKRLSEINKKRIRELWVDN